MMTLTPEDFSSGPAGLNKCPRCDEMKYIRLNDLCARCCKHLDDMVTRTIADLEAKILERTEPNVSLTD